jgi:RNA polymerase sigma-70 factor (ECF subfamily)
MTEYQPRRDLSCAEPTEPLDESVDARPLQIRQRNTLPEGEELGALLDSLQPSLQAVAIRITRDRESAQDAVQTTFEKVIRHRNRFRAESRFSTWIHRILINEALLLLRSQRRRREVIGARCERTADQTPGAAEKLLALERRNWLHRGLEKLRVEDRKVVEHCGLAAWSYADYSAHTGVHVAAVKSRAFRARSRLRILLTES